MFFCEFGAGEASEAVVFLFGGVGRVVVEGWVGVLVGACGGRERIAERIGVATTSRAKLIHGVRRHGKFFGRGGRKSDVQRASRHAGIVAKEEVGRRTE